MAVDMFLKLDGVKGEAQDKTHGQEIDVLAWSWGMSQSGTMHIGTGGGGGKVAVHDIAVTKWIDKSSPVLMQYCSSGKQFNEGVLTVRKAGGKAPLEYVVITMKDVIVTSLSTGGSGGEDRLTENVSLNFREVKVEYQPQKADGTADGGKIPWGMDIAANEQKG
jgi:type VI secretion system secreted protein Hcp